MLNLVYNSYFFVRHFPSFCKFWITNYRYKKYGYRNYLFKLQEKIPKEKGGGFSNPIEITLRKCYDTEETFEARDKKGEVIPGTFNLKRYGTLQTAFLDLRDRHKDIFKVNDHLTYKEII